MEEKKVCVTGGAGYLASFLISHLLERGYTVHATLRTLRDATKVALLNGLPNANTRLKLFEADIYDPRDFASAVEGCEFVVHMATPLQHDPTSSKYKNTSEAAVAGVKSIMEACIESSTVKKVIYTASVVAASPLKGDGSSYKDFMDETCWSPLDIPYEVLSDYVYSKTLAEKQVLSYDGKGIQVVSLALGLVGGDTIQPFMSGSMGALISQARNDGVGYKNLRFLEDLLAKVPIAHIRDVTEAHVFSMENREVNGRFLCASGYLKSAEIASLINKCGHDISSSIPQELVEDVGERGTRWGSRKLESMGFQYKCDAQKIITDSLICAKRLLSAADK